ncbi:type I DNA topoisomerase [Candidatus Woesebacteria bacterium]|nr:type I DNA topoisomerase [Candidatus Woesebacteria bacterium]
MQLIIVESPTKARTLSRFLGGGYEVEATMGHIKDLPKSKLGVDVEKDFAPDYQLVEKKRSLVSGLRRKAKGSKIIYLATDPDREGEAISAHVEEILKNATPMKRIVFHEITKEAVEDAIKHPRKIDKNLVDAQIARRVLDRLVGYQLSPVLWRKVRRGLSAGRVQSVTVRLIVEKEREIQAFKSVEYWEVFVTLNKLSGKQEDQFAVQLVKADEKKAEIKNKEESDRVVTELNKANYKVLSITKKEVRKSSYPPYTTSTMTQAGANLFGWSSKKTMMIAQKLYEEGLITYHRTDSTNIASIAMEKVRRFIKGEFGTSYLPESPRYYKKTSKVAQEAHEAVRPTNIEVLGSSEQVTSQGNDNKKLYELIWKRFVSSQMNPSVYDETTIEVVANPGNYLLRVSGQIMKFDGWRRVFPSGKADQEVISLPDLQNDEALNLVKVDSSQKFTQPPARYNEASIIKTLEKLGIGRPSTYAPTISTILFRGYVEKEEGKFIPTNVGFAVSDFLVKNFPDIVDYKFTADMEGDLDKIANGERDWVDSIRSFYKPFDKKVIDVTKNAERVKIETEKLGRSCPECKEGELVIRSGRFGKFISCSRFPDCKYTERLVEKINMICPDCGKGEVIIKKTKKGRKFYGCSRYPDCKFASWKKPVIQKVVVDEKFPH